MVFYHDDAGEFEAPLDLVWAYFRSPGDHRTAHGHRHSRLESLTETCFLATWEQEFAGRSVEFQMRGTEFPPLGFAYEVLRGPFAGSKFFNYYRPRGPRTGVTLVGEFRSLTLPDGELEAAVRAFFDTEFEQDRAGLLGMSAPRGSRL